MFRIWAVEGTSIPYDWQAVAAVQRPRQPDAWDDKLRDPGQPAQARPAPRDPRRDPYGAAQRRAAPKRQTRQPLRTAGEIMTAPVVTLGPDTTLGDAWDLIQRRRFRHLPVVAPSGRVMGVLSDRDLLRVAGTPDRAPAQAVATLQVRQIMATRVFSATPEASIRDVAGVMFHNRIGCMPIVDDDGTVIGILTRSDILRALITRAPLALWA